MMESYALVATDIYDVFLEAGREKKNT